jgi:hypothetical protein
VRHETVLQLAVSLVSLAWAPFFVIAQTPATPPPALPKIAVNADGSITFRLSYPSAKQVTSPPTRCRSRWL